SEYKTQNARFDRPIPDDKDVNNPARARVLGLGETVSIARVNAKRVPEMARAYISWNRSIPLYISARSATYPFAQLHSRTLLSTCGKVVLCERKCMRKIELFVR
ncbi:hypothetical protein TSAR_013178, partial [Trichomalopsis sarcophagae]